MWRSVDAYWQETLGLAWEAFREGNVPVGSIIVDAEGGIVSRGQNAIFDSFSNSPLAGTNMAHAEMNALCQLQKGDHGAIRRYTLYTSLEPCPMCFGAAVMMGIRHIRYGARDAIAGSIALRAATPYLSSKKIKVGMADTTLEVFQLALVTAFELKREHSRLTEFLERLRSDCPVGVAVGTELFKRGYFSQAIKENYPAGQVFQDVVGCALQRGF